MAQASSLPLPLLLSLPGTSRPLAGRLEHRPLDRSNPLLEAGWARPRKARRGCKSARQRRLRQAHLTVVVESCTEAARQQLATFFARLALTRGWREAATLRGLAHSLKREG